MRASFGDHPSSLWKKRSRTQWEEESSTKSLDSPSQRVVLKNENPKS